MRLLPVRYSKWAIMGAMLAAVLCTGTAVAQGRLFGIVGKSADDENFSEVARSCNAEANRAGDRCILVASRGSSHPRRQSELIAQALARRKFDGLAISVTEARMVGDALKAASVPLVIYDSPLSKTAMPMAPAYIGIDNIASGRQLARLAIKLKPQGGVLCIITGHNEANLQQRLAGARQEFSGNPAFPATRRLSGEGGWTEAPYCPFNAGDDHARTLLGMTVALRNSKVDAIVSLGHWPIKDPGAYRQAIAPFHDRLKGAHTIVIVALGAPSAGQLRLLTDRLVHGVVLIDFTALGRECYRQLKALVDKRPAPPIRLRTNVSIIALP